MFPIRYVLQQRFVGISTFIRESSAPGSFRAKIEGEHVDPLERLQSAGLERFVSRLHCRIVEKTINGRL